MAEDLAPGSFQFLVDIVVDALDNLPSDPAFQGVCYGISEESGTGFSVVDQPVVHIGGHLSFYQRRGC